MTQPKRKPIRFTSQELMIVILLISDELARKYRLPQWYKKLRNMRRKLRKL